MTAQNVNYTAEQTAQLVNDYRSGATVESLAAALGRSVKSVVAKLVREGEYKSKAKTKGATRVTKADLIKDMAYQCGVKVEQLASLEKASLEALQIVHGKLM